MKSYAKIYQGFWTNGNDELHNLGLEARLIAIYLFSNSHRNMLGVYYLPLSYAAIDLRLPVEKVCEAMNHLCQIGYCTYDESTHYVWVYNMIVEQVGENFDAKDNRIKGINIIWQSLPQRVPFSVF